MFTLICPIHSAQLFFTGLEKKKKTNALIFRLHRLHYEHFPMQLSVHLKKVLEDIVHEIGPET